MNHFSDLAQTYIDAAIYRGLFGVTIANANKLLKLQPTATEEKRRDYMGTLALQALAQIEGTLTAELNANHTYLMGELPLERIMETARSIAAGIGQYYADHGVSGAALLTSNGVQS